jgi:acetyl esterase/lipase
MKPACTAAAVALLLGLAASACAQEQAKTTAKTFPFKNTTKADKITPVSLEMHVHFPADWKKDDKRPAIVFFFGGGWSSGTVQQFEPQAAYLASRGLVAARADYRVKSRHEVTPDACVEDAKSAVRWLRQNAATLGIDPERIVASGGSAGGHIAACTACPGLDAEGEDQKISSRPNALLLFNPVLRFDGDAGLMARINQNEQLGKAISPTLHLTKGTPPALLFYGKNDGLFKQGEEYVAKSKEVGHRAEMYLAEGVGHGFFNGSPWRERTLVRADEFLESLGYLKGKPTIQAPNAAAQPAQLPPLPPTQPNVKYGPHERNVLDFWQAESKQPTPVLVSIHGGGFVAGDKSVPAPLLKDCLAAGISVAAINYRYSTQAIAPAPFQDGARAVQFLRSKAKDWNLDPQRFAATGGSAGAGISLWLGFHKDLADPKSEDPVLRQSTRLTCMVVFEGQTSYDPRFIRQLFPGKDIYKIGALQRLFDIDPNKLDDLPAEKYRLFEEVSPLTHVTKDAPPVLLMYNNPLDAEITNQGIGIHHPLFGKMLKEKMDALQVPCEVVAAGKRLDGGTPTRAIDFLKAHFGLKK